jgi:predicted transcriptional regulator
MIFKADLKKCGFTDKEAAVYLAALSVGPSPVQKISRKAEVARATTYVVLEALIEKGFIVQYNEGKKKMFAAEHPSQLTKLLKKQEAVLQEQHHHLQELLPRLEALMKNADGQPMVRYYAGREGLQAMRQEMTRYSMSGDTWYSLTPMDNLIAIFGKDEFLYYKQRCARGIKSQSIFSTTSESLKQKLFATAAVHCAERKYVPPAIYSSNSGLTIFRDRVAIGSFKSNKCSGLVIESASVATMMSELFNLAWLHL